MFPSFLLALREGIEAALIIGILLGALTKIDRKELKPAIWGGVTLAIIVSFLAAIVLNHLGASFQGRAEQIFEGTAMLTAAALLTWMIFWMHRQSSSIKSNLDAQVRFASLGGSGAIFALAFISISREGFELALFLTAVGINANPWVVLIGAIMGLAVSFGLGYLLFASTRRLNMRNFFLVTNILLILFAAGLVAHGIHEFNEALLIPPVIEHVWDMNNLIDESSTTGLILKALFGYNGNPSLTEVIAYISYFTLVWVLFKLSTTRQVTVAPVEG